MGGAVSESIDPKRQRMRDGILDGRDERQRNLAIEDRVADRVRGRADADASLMRRPSRPGRRRRSPPRASRSTLRCLILAQSASEGRQRGSVVGNRSTSPLSSNRTRTVQFLTPSVLSLQTKVGATISGGKSVSSRGYLISMPPVGSPGNASGAGADCLAAGAEGQHRCEQKTDSGGGGLPSGACACSTSVSCFHSRAIVGDRSRRRQTRPGEPSARQWLAGRHAIYHKREKLTGHVHGARIRATSAAADAPHEHRARN